MKENEKYSKREVGFEHPAKGEDHCGDCRHFEVQRKNGCEIVAGYIESADWCRKFKERRTWLKVARR